MLRGRILRRRPLLSTHEAPPSYCDDDSDRMGRRDAKKNDPTIQRVEAPPPRNDKVSHRTKRTDVIDQPSQSQEGTMQCNAHCKSSKKILFLTERIRRRQSKTPPDKIRATHTEQLIMSMENQSQMTFTSSTRWRHLFAACVSLFHSVW